jgi:hydrogenase maturation protease
VTDAAAGLGTRLVIGIGNRFRSDDAVGPLIADRLAAAGIPAIEHGGDGPGLIEAWGDHETVILVDAMKSVAPAGTIRRIDAQAEPVPAGLFHYSTHQLGLAEAIEMARTLDRLPPRLIIYGIEGVAFNFGETLSPAVGEALDAVCNRIRADLLSG